VYKSLAIVFAVLCSIILMPNTSTQAASSDRCFAETGFCISGRIRSYWELNGGLPVFGFPTSNLQSMNIEGKTFMAQNFERNRLELHPENNPPYDVLIGRVGALNMMQIFGAETSDVMEKVDYNTATVVDGSLAKDSKYCKWFNETRQFVCGAFLYYWQTHGLQLDGKKSVSEAESLALFGLPLSYTMNSDAEGKKIVVQIFERARFEYHDDKPEPYKVLLGLLGNEFLTQSGGNNSTTTTTTTTTATKTATVTVYVQFNIGAVATKFEISPAGKNQWTYYVDENQNIAQAKSGTIWIYPVDIYDNNYTVDIRVNSAVVWQNVIIKDKRLVILGYNTGPYVVSYQDNFR
jgi:hypothetical protein